MANQESKKTAEALAAPFPPEEVHWRPGAVSGNRALALPYIDVRQVMERLDSIFGVDGWESSYRFLNGGTAVLCRLRVRFGDDEWVCKMDVGGESDQPDEGDRYKAAVSDSLKRAAVHLGVGRYLYRASPQWVDWDAAKKQFKVQPVLPGNGGTAPPRTITEAERAELLKMLAKKGKTPGAALKAVGCSGPDLASLNFQQYQQLLVKLHKMPDLVDEEGPYGPERA